MPLGKWDCAARNWAALFLTQVGSPLPRQPADLSSLGSSDWHHQTPCGNLAGRAHCSPRLVGTHPPPEKLGWWAWSTTPSFFLTGSQKLRVLTVFLVMREGIGTVFQRANTMPWIDLAGEDTTAVWTHSSFCYLCERDEVRLTSETLWVTAEHVNQNPRPIGGICPLQSSNSSSSWFCSSLIIKCRLRDKMKMWNRSFKNEAA